MTRVTVALTRTCNNACLFCAQAGLEADSPPFDAALEAARASADEVTFVGGEPTLVPQLADAIRRARTLGFRRVGLQTNGRRLANPALVASLVDAGLTDVHVTLLGATAEVHDYHTAVSGSFHELLAGVGAARGRGLLVVASTVLTRSNYRVLAQLPPLLSSRGIQGWRLVVPVVAGRAAAAIDRLIPRLALAIPYGLHALEASRRLGLEVQVDGAPGCLLGPFARASRRGETRAWAPACEACPAREQCPGVDATYLARFGPEELKALPEPVTPAPLTDVTRCFTDLGEVFLPIDLRVPAPPAQARAELAALGKSAPGLAEAPGRKSGEALRTLFPELFKDADPRR